MPSDIDIATILTTEIIQSVRDLVGGDYQAIMLTEEISELQVHLAELQKQLCKHLRHAKEDEKKGILFKERPCIIGIAEEMADVELMLREVEWMLDIKNEVRVHYPEKITRLLERIEIIKEENRADAKP